MSWDLHLAGWVQSTLLWLYPMYYFLRMIAELFLHNVLNIILIFFTPMCGLWWMVQNQSTFLVFPQTTWPGHDSQEKVLNSRFPENQPHRHLMRVHECKFVSLGVVWKKLRRAQRNPTYEVIGAQYLSSYMKKLSFSGHPKANVRGLWHLGDSGAQTNWSILQNAIR